MALVGVLLVVVRVVLHHVAEASEEILGVARSCRGFGVVLHRECGVVERAQALNDIIVEREVRHFDATEARRRFDDLIDRGIHRKTVILARDLDATSALVDHRLIDAAVAEGQLVGLETERAAEQLVAEADAEVRHPSAEHLLQQLDVALACGGVARAVREEDGGRGRQALLRRAPTVDPAADDDAEGGEREDGDRELHAEVGDREAHPERRDRAAAEERHRLVRPAHVDVGGDEGKRKAWMSSYNKALVGQPNQLIRKADGLVRTLAYLDGMRAAS